LLDAARRERLSRSPRRAAFYCGAVSSLDAALRARGSALSACRGDAAAIERLARRVGAATVVWAAEYDAASQARQRELQGELEEAGLRALIIHDAPVAPPDDVAAARSADGGAGYRAFVPYVNAWKETLRPPLSLLPRFAAPEFEGDPLPEAVEFGAEALPDAPSEASAAAALEAFASGPLLHYLTARNVPADATSQLSAHLSFGTLAARTVVARVAERARDRFLLAEERLALEAFRRSLALRDFFLQLAWFFETQPDRVLQERMCHFPFARTHPALAAWLEGRTGYPLVDAGIRELRATGRMHPRARAVAASFLCFDLGVDWRVGRDAWDAQLIEDEPALAAGNWQWIAGVGADLAQFPRIYNPRKQARTLDPRGTYVRRWIPELAAAPGGHAAAARPGAAQLALPLFAAETYPAPVVDHEEAAREFLRRYVDFAATRR
jgi:deoxyribodipyrimidine photo-lyase